MSTRWPLGRLALLVLSLAAADAWSRVANGGHSGASSSPSDSVSSIPLHGTGGGGMSIGSVIVLLLIALVLWFIYRRMTGGGGLQAASPGGRDAIGAALGSVIAGSLTGAAAAPRSIRSPLPAVVDTIVQQDPGFEIETFLQRAEMSFFLVKRGLQKNDAAAIRPFLSDALFDQLSQTIGQMKGRHRHTLLESLTVPAVHIVDGACDAQGQRLRVHFDLVYRAKTLDDANKILEDEGEDRRHGEQWTFVRGPGVKTPTAGDVTASRCPACGAELRLNLDGTCNHCKASVTNGSIDWVVADVSPAEFAGFNSESQFAVAATTVGEGLANLKAADAPFSPDAFCSRVRTAFMALQDAWCKQNLDAGRAFLSPGAYFAWSAQLETMAAEGRRNVMEHLEIQSVVPTRVVHGRVFDDLTVKITAASSDYELDKEGKIVFGDRTVRPFTEQWTFQRSVGVATSNKPGTLENTCPSCGAPIALTQIGECRYCKAAVTSGKFDWVVSRIEQEDTNSASDESGVGNIGEAIAVQVGGALVGGLLSELLAGRPHDDRNI